MKKLLLFIFVLSLVACNNVSTETPTQPSVDLTAIGEPDGPHTSAEWKIWAYSTGAPSFIASNCTVIDIDGTVLRESVTNCFT